MLTELVFEHALRVRMKAETSESGKSDGSSRAATDGASTAIGTPDNASVIEPAQEGSEGESGSSGSGDESRTATLTAPPPSLAKGKQKAQEPESAPKEEAPKDGEKAGKSKHLVGRINNLVSSDLGNVQDAGMHLTFGGESAFSRASRVIDEGFVGCSARGAIPGDPLHSVSLPDSRLEVRPSASGMSLI